MSYSSEYEVTTHFECPEAELAHKLDLFATILDDLGAPTSPITEWLAGISWESDGSGFGRLSDPVPLGRARLNGDIITARPYVLGYTPPTVPGTMPWVQLSLEFAGEWEISYFEGGEGRFHIGGEERQRYVAGIGQLVWGVIQAFVRRLPNLPVFCNDSASVNFPWYALLGKDYDLWDFDAASIPTSLAHVYAPTPSGYARTASESHVGFARMSWWQVPPWDE
jgi:hypothetical protein